MASLRALVPDRTTPPAPPVLAPPAPAARPSLFPAGLVADVRPAASEERPAASIGWDVQYAQLGEGHCRRRFVGVHTAGLQVCLEEWSVGVLKRGRPPRGSVTFLVPVGAGGSPRIQGRAAGAGAVVVLFDGDELDYRSDGPARLVTVSAERTVLEGHVRALLGRHLGELRLQGRLAGLWTDGATLWRLGLDLAARGAADPRSLRDCGLAAARERRILEALFARFETPCAPAPPSRGRALARRAEAWLRQNLAEPPSIAALSDALHASERTVHEAFREHLGTTPKAYLKALRLNAARHDLLRGGERTRVTDVALDWGFLHFGWFSQDYRRLFGETPSETLQRGRAEAVRRGFGRDGRGSRPRASGPLAGMYAM